ncbi:hypothetical protein BSKO_08015 [Bryopsis sp. KO-2023]|nr:hypothetical protein BSKO_08015 [Bryopsis sp. KO-2023]
MSLFIRAVLVEAGRYLDFLQEFLRKLCGFNFGMPLRAPSSISTATTIENHPPKVPLGKKSTRPDTSELSSGEYIVWELLASRYVHAETLQSFALVSRTHRDILRNLAQTTAFWTKLKSTALRYANENFDAPNLVVLKALADGPLATPRAQGCFDSGDEKAKIKVHPNTSTLVNPEGHVAREIEEDVRRFLKLCYFPVQRVSACKSMLVFRNVPEAGPNEDSPKLKLRMSNMICKHAKKSLEVRGAHRLNVNSAQVGGDVPWRFSETQKKKPGVRSPRRPVLVMFESQPDAEFVFARRGIFRRTLKVQLELCSMPWDMDESFKPGRKERI